VESLPQILQNVRYGGRPAARGQSRAHGDRRHFVIRPSGTEPLIRVMAEGDDEQLVSSVVSDIVEAVKQVAIVA
jgi:phosphoglucosamine mutase